MGLAELARCHSVPLCFVEVSICQADLGLAELHLVIFLIFSLQCFNLPGRFGFGRTAMSSVIRQYCQSFNLPGRFGFGRTFPFFSPYASSIMFQSARQIWVWPNASSRKWPRRGRPVSICQADLGLAEPRRRVRPRPRRQFQSARQIWVWLNSSLKLLR